MKGIAVIKLENGEMLEYEVVEETQTKDKLILVTPICTVTLSPEKIMYTEFYETTPQEYMAMRQRESERVDNK